MAVVRSMLSQQRPNRVPSQRARQLLLPVHAWRVDLALQPFRRRSLCGQPPQEAPQVRDHVLQRRATDSGGDLLNECLQLARRQLPETHGRPLVGDELQKLGDGGEVVGDGPGSKPAERRRYC